MSFPRFRLPRLRRVALPPWLLTLTLGLTVSTFAQEPTTDQQSVRVTLLQVNDV